VNHPEEYHNVATGSQQVPRVGLPPSTSHNSHMGTIIHPKPLLIQILTLFLDHQLGSRRPPRTPVSSGTSSWASQRGGGSRPSTQGSSFYAPGRTQPSPVLPTANGVAMHSPDDTTWFNRDASHTDWPPASEHSLPLHQESFRHDRLLDPDPYAGSAHQLSDRASKTTSRSSLRTKRSLLSRLSMGTSVTSFPFSAKSRNLLNHNIPSPSLSMASMLGTPSQGSTSAISAHSWGQGMLWQTSDAWPAHSHAGPSSQTTFDRLMAETSLRTVQMNPAHDNPQTVHVVDGVVTSGTLEGLVQFLITGFSEQSCLSILTYTHNL
jgi:hypothetical protein